MPRIPLHVLIIVALVFAYLGWIAESRWSRSRTETARIARAGKPDIPDDYLPKGTGVKIVNFYSAAGEIYRGDQAVICYSVVNAASVRIDPPVEDLKPSINRCFAVKPDSKTTYTLKAEGTDGSTATASFAIEVSPPPPKIEMMEISARAIKRGQPFQMCYTTRNTDKVRLDPPAAPVQPGEKRCYLWFPVQRTKYTLTAWGDRGKTDQLSFTLLVQSK